MDDTSFTYSPGGWTHLDSSGSNGTAANQTVRSDFPDLSHFADRTASVSTMQGATANVTFQGGRNACHMRKAADHRAAEAIYVYGMSGPEGGSANVLLDGHLTQTLNFSVSHTLWRYSIHRKLTPAPESVEGILVAIIPWKRVQYDRYPHSQLCEPHARSTNRPGLRSPHCSLHVQLRVSFDTVGHER